MLISDAEARAHLRIDAGEVITVYIGAAQNAAVNYLNRQVFETQIALDAAVAAGTAGTDPMVVTDAIKSAMLLILGHLYENREDVVVGSTGNAAVALPMGSQYLLQPYRLNIGI